MNRSSAPEEQGGEAFVAALLPRLAESDAGRAQAQARVDRAMARLDRDTQAPVLSLSRRLWRRTRAVAAVAASLLLLLLGLDFGTRTPAAALTPEATIARSLEVLNLATDRRFEVRVTTPHLGGRRRIDVYTRGRDQFVLRVEAPGREDIWIGRQGGESWIVPPRPGTPVLVTEDLARVRRWADQRGVPVPFLEAGEVLERIEADGKVRWQRRATDAEGRPVLRLLAVRRGDAAGFPDRVFLEVDEESGRMRRLVMDWERERWTGRKALFRRVELREMPSEPKAADFYGHGAHAADRPVRRLR